MSLPQLASFDFKGKRVLIRGDFDVPFENGKVVDASRIAEGLPTIKYLLEHGASEILLIGHLGRPEGKVVEGLRMAPVAKKLSELLNFQPGGLERFGGFEGYRVGGNITLLENLRFDPREESNDAEFAKDVAGLGDFFINEAFAVSHREHASIVGLPKLLPHGAGLHFTSEVENLSKVLAKPKRPLVVIIGGAKTETKIPVIEGLFSKADIFLTGGVVANTLIVADEIHPKKLGLSKIDENSVSEARRMLSLQEGKRTNFSGWGEIWKVKLPPDLIIADKSGNKEETVYISGKTGEIFDQNKTALDIGPETVALYGKIIDLAGTIIWNGPMGKYEDEKFGNGTRKIAEAIAGGEGFKVVGGGDTIAALKKYNLLDKMDYVSTAGGAMLEFLSKGTLPGIEALK